MKTLSKKKFIAQTPIPEALAKAVIAQCGGWEEFKGIAPDVTQHGAAGGFSGWIYYTETVEFSNANRDSIIALAKQQADDFGMDWLQMAAGFNSFKGDKFSASDIAEAIYSDDSDNQQTVLNALAWYALEETARSYCDLLEN